MHVVIVASGSGVAAGTVDVAEVGAAAAGSWVDGRLARSVLASADLVVAADGGADLLRSIGSRPDVLVGDCDSVLSSTRRLLLDDGVEVVEFSTAKDETDTELALRLAVDRDATRITVLGVLGGPRLDHLVGNLLLLTAPWLRGCEVRLLDRATEVFLARGDATLAGAPGELVSLLALTPVVEDVHTEGLAYPLRGEPLYQGATRGVSNELTAEPARVRHGAGELLVIQYRGLERADPEAHAREENHAK